MKMGHEILGLREYSLGYQAQLRSERLPRKRILDKVDFSFKKGTFYGIVGYTGCGKTTLLRQLMKINDPDLLWSEGQLHISPGTSMKIVMQQPFTTFNPLLSVYAHLEESYGGNALSSEQRNEINDLLLRYRLWGIDDDRLRDVPTTFSVGQLQRFSWVMAISSRPDLLLLDEPLAHVDVATTEIFLKDLHILKEKGMTILLVSHLRKLLESTCDETYIMQDGHLSAYANDSIQLQYMRPKQNYDAEPIFKFLDICFERKSSDKSEGATILNKFNLEIYPGEHLGIYGESGSGKSTLAKIAAGRISDYRGKVIFKGLDITRLNRKQRAQIIQYLPQDPVNLFPGRVKVSRLIEELVALHSISMSSVGELQEIYPQIKNIMNASCQELSGGQHQLLLFYLSLLLSPDLLIIDENFTAMDPTLYQQSWDAITLRQEHKEMAVMLISHQYDDMEVITDRQYSIQSLQNL